MRCIEAQPLFPAVLDDAVCPGVPGITGAAMQALSSHMETCAPCRSEFHKLKNTHLLVSALGRKAAPPDLSLKIRLALSRERSRTWNNILQYYVVRLENLANAFMFPATAGILSTIFFFCAIAGFFVQAEASSDEMVSNLYLSPRLQPPQTAMSSVADADLNLDIPVVIRAYVDANGRVQNYEFIAGPDTPQIRSQLNRALLFTSFSPAKNAFGQPVSGVAVISFSHVNVKG